MFPLYNPSRDYMQAFAAAKRSAEPQFMDEESRFNALDQVHSLLYDLSEFEDTSTQCNWGLFSDIELATLYNKVPSKRFEIIMTDDPTAEQYAAMVKKYIPNFKAPATCGSKAKADCVCEPDKVKETIQDILSGKIDKTKEMARMAELHGALSLGNPTDNFLGALNVRNAV
jgi:hypothetical protein